MSAPLRRRRRTILLLSAALTGTAVLAGCGAGLLPAESLGTGTVAPLTLDELVARAQLAGRLAGITVTLENCTTALEAMRGAPPQPEDLEGFAAQLAKGDRPRSLTVEVLAAGPLVVDAVQRPEDAVAACPEVTVTVPERGSATVGLQVLEAPELADGAAAVSVTTTVTPPSGQPITVPALVGMVQDGDRLLTLLSTGQDGKSGAEAFLDLLEEAHRHQDDALD